MANIGAPPKFGDLSRMTYSPNVPGIVTGNPIIDMALSMMMGGQGATPVPGQGQGVYDAYLQRERSRSYLRFMQQGFGQSMVMQKIGGGMNTDSGFGQIMTMLAGRPDGIMDSKLMRAFNGGNPVKSLMALNANMTGQTMGMAFGNTGNASEAEVKSFFAAAQNQLFEQKRITQQDVNKVSAFNSQEITNKLSKNANTENFFKEFITSDDKGNKSFDMQKFKGKAKEYAEKAKNSADQAIIDAYDEVLSRSNSVAVLEGKIGKGVASRVNAEMMRGYQLDDMTKTATMAMDLGLLYDEDTRFSGDAASDPRKARQLGLNYFANAGGVLRSVSDLTGAETAESAMSQLNDLLGNSNLNMGDKDDASRIEDLMRRFKGAARAAGISIEAIMGINNTAKALSSQYSSLAYQGGVGVMETSMKAVQTATAMASTMGPDWVRRNGGTLNLQNELTQTLVENKDEPVVKGLAAWASAINQSTRLSPEEKESALQMLSKAAQDKSTFTPQGMDQLTQKMAGILGVSKTRALGIRESKLGQQAGMEFLELRRMAGDDLGIEEAAVGATVADFIQGTRAELLDDKFEVRNADGSLMSADQRIQAFMDGLGRGEKLETMAQKYGLDQSNFVNNRLSGDTPESRRYRKNLEMDSLRNNPAYRRAFELQRSITNQYAAESKRMAKKMAKLQTPFLDTLAQEFVSGNFGGAIEGVKDVFITDSARQRTTAILESAKKLSTDKTDASFKEAMLEMHGGAAGLTDEQLKKNLSDEYVTDPAELARIQSVRHAMTTGDMDYLTDVSKSLTMSQIMSADEKWEGSAAQKAGLKKWDVQKAAKFLRDTGLNSSDVMSKYGSQSFNDVKDKLPMHTALRKVSDIASKDMIKDIKGTGDKQFESYIAGLQAKEEGETDADLESKKKTRQEVLGALDVFGLVKRNEAGDVVDIDTGKAMEEVRSGSVLDGMTADELRHGATAGTLTDDVEASLIQKGILSKDKSGKFHIDGAKLDEEVSKDQARKILAREQILSDGSKGISEAIDAADKGKKTSEEQFNEKVMKSLESALGTNTQHITKALNELNQNLRSFTGGG